MNQESRTLLAITFLLAALFVAMNRMVESAPLIDFWLALALLVIGLVLALASRFDLGRGRTHEEVAAEAAAPALAHTRVYEFTAGAAPQLASATPVVVTAAETLPMTDESATSSSADDLDLDDVTVDEPAPPPVNGTEKLDDNNTPAG
ncbi:MAG: hypothetical protein IPK19_28675 [Chloroflexi bacterium]|nr:hypothetical protein [Chloroflexota bacterium]